MDVDLRHPDPQLLRLLAALPVEDRRRARQLLGLFVNVLAFAVIAFILCGAQFQIDGTIIDSPTDIVAAIPNTLFLSLACLAS